MAIKTHLADSPEPLKEGVDIAAKCGALIPSAAFVFMWDEQEVGELIGAELRLNVCRKCADCIAGGRYVYGITDGESQERYLAVARGAGE